MSLVRTVIRVNAPPQPQPMQVCRMWIPYFYVLIIVVLVLLLVLVCAWLNVDLTFVFLAD